MYGGLTCTQNGVVTEESTTVCNHLTYVFFIDNRLNHNADAFVEIYIQLSSTGWAEDGSDLPKNPVTVTAAPIVITATQSSSAH